MTECGVCAARNQDPTGIHLRTCPHCGAAWPRPWPIQKENPDMPTDTDNDTGLDPDTASLLAAIVQHNVDSLALTTDAVIAGEHRAALRFAKALITVVAGIESLPDTARSVFLDDLAAAAQWDVAAAYRALDEAADPE